MCSSRKHHKRSGGMAVIDRSTKLKADDLRASDTEREGVVTDLRVHAAEGRLTVDELDERVGRAYAARTHRDLVALTADLPRTRRPRPARDARAELAGHVRSYLQVMALLLAIWLFTGTGYFWPIWPALGWGIAVLMHASSARRPARTARP